MQRQELCFLVTRRRTDSGESDHLEHTALGDDEPVAPMPRDASTHVSPQRSARAANRIAATRRRTRGNAHS